jgi:hypothetical protein
MNRQYQSNRQEEGLVGAQLNWMLAELQHTKIILLGHIQATVMYNNAKACYKRIIKNISNLTLLQEGLPIEFAKLHTKPSIPFNIKSNIVLGLEQYPIAITIHNQLMEWDKESVTLLRDGDFYVTC